MADEAACWLVIGGGLKAGIYRAWYPHLSLWAIDAAAPIAIECESEREARQLHRIFQQTLKTLPPEPSAADILSAFQHAETVRNFFPDGTRDFYAVAIGARLVFIARGITGAERSKGSFMHHSYRHMQSFWEALAFMIVKGQETRMPLLLTPAELAQDDASRVGPLEEAFHQNLHLRSLSPMLATMTTPTRTSWSSSLHEWHYDNPITPGHHAPEAYPTSSCTSSSAMPIIYIHVWNLGSVVSSHHHISQPSAEDRAQAQRLGEAGARYVLAHGYSSSDIATIVQIYRCNASTEPFALQLAALGMALAEATYLGDLIYM
ncbi:hypothetical protein EDD15DRAFT_2359661 [Pisolithus albus]|nr:hypothetical protein EDD15DRAFT_2359661 [Pisolithus albus]